MAKRPADAGAATPRWGSADWRLLKDWRRPFCGPKYGDHDWHRTIRRGYVVRCHCLRCGAVPLDVVAAQPLTAPQRGATSESNND